MIGDYTVFRIHFKLILIPDFFGDAGQFHHQESAVNGITIKNSGKRTGDHCSNFSTPDRPDGVFAAGPAAEIIAQRANAQSPDMGLTTWSGERPRKSDIGVAKNYLTKDEIEALNLIVSFYLDFAELQGLSRKPMYMRDWIAKLDEFLRLSERDILSHAGRISHDDALAKAEAEYEKYCATRASLPSPVERHFDEAVEEIKKLQAEPRTKPPKSKKPRKQTRRPVRAKGKRGKPTGKEGRDDA